MFLLGLNNFPVASCVKSPDHAAAGAVVLSRQRRKGNDMIGGSILGKGAFWTLVGYAVALLSWCWPSLVSWARQNENICECVAY